MVVAVVTVGVVKSAVDDVVGMVSMGNRLVSTARAVDMVIVVLDRCALVWIRLVDLQMVLIIVVTVFVVHMAVMQVVGVTPCLILV